MGLDGVEAALRDFGDRDVPEATEGALLAIRRIHSAAMSKCDLNMEGDVA